MQFTLIALLQNPPPAPLLQGVPMQSVLLNVEAAKGQACSRVVSCSRGLWESWTDFSEIFQAQDTGDKI